jgi:hypothetical protein
LLKDSFLGVTPSTDLSVSVTNSSQYAVPLNSAGFSGTYYNASLTSQFNLAELPNLSVGESFLTQFTLGNGDIAYGSATITSLIDPPELGTMTVSFQGIEVPASTAVVPEPSTWAMMLLGFGAIGFAARRRKRTATRTRATAGA